MADFDSMVDRAQELVGNYSTTNLLTDAVVGRFVNSRHRSLLESRVWARAKQEILIVIVADESSGTLAVTQGASTATITGGSFSSADEGKYIRIGSDNDIYLVKTISGSTLTFGDLNGTTVNYQGTTDSAATYEMFQRFYSLGTAIEQIISVVHGTQKLREVDQEFLDKVDPARSSTGTTARAFARAARDQSSTNDLVRIEFFPRLTAATVVRATIRKGHTTLSGTTNPIVPSGPVEWFAAVDCAYFLFAKTSDEKWMTLAQKYNEEAEKCLEREANEDAKKFGLADKIRDVGEYGLAGTDYETDHDLYPPGRV